MTHVPADQLPGSSTVTTSRSQAHPNGVLVALLGVLSLIGQLLISVRLWGDTNESVNLSIKVFVVSSAIALITWWIAARARKQIFDEPDVEWSNTRLVNVGYVTGLIGFVNFSLLISIFGWLTLFGFAIRST